VKHDVEVQLDATGPKGPIFPYTFAKVELVEEDAVGSQIFLGNFLEANPLDQMPVIGEQQRLRRSAKQAQMLPAVTLRCF
jgi:hypothetical protein